MKLIFAADKEQHNIYSRVTLRRWFEHIIHGSKEEQIDAIIAFVSDDRGPPRARDRRSYHDLPVEREEIDGRT